MRKGTFNTDPDYHHDETIQRGDVNSECIIHTEHEVLVTSFSFLPLVINLQKRNICKRQNSAGFLFFFFNIGIGKFPNLMSLKHLNFGCLETAWYTLLYFTCCLLGHRLSLSDYLYDAQKTSLIFVGWVFLEPLWKKWKNTLMKFQSGRDTYLYSIPPSHFSERKGCLHNQKITFVDQRMRGILFTSHAPSACRFRSTASLKHSVWQHKWTTPILSHQM